MDSTDMKEVTMYGDEEECNTVVDTKEEEKQTATLPPPPDGGYGWVVVAAVFFVHVFILGSVYSFGVFYTDYEKEFNTSAASISWIGSLGACLMGGLGNWTGKYADRYGNNWVIFVSAIFTSSGLLLASFSTELWHLYLTQGIITGIGYSCGFIAGVSVVGQWFTTRRGLAVGMAVAGSGLGQFCVALMTGYFLQNYRWRTTLRLLALITFVGLTLCAIFTRRYLPCITVQASESAPNMFQQNRNFNIMFAALFVYSLGMFMPYNYIEVYSERYGVSLTNAVLILSLVGISSAVGRIVLGFGGDRIGKVGMLRLCMLGSAVSTYCWVACTTFPSILAYGLFYGFFAGGTVSLLPPVAAELFGLKNLATMIGMLSSATAAGNLLSAPIGGFLLQATGNYFWSQIVAATFLMVGFLIFSLIRRDVPHFDENSSSCEYNQIEVKQKEMTEVDGETGSDVHREESSQVTVQTEIEL